MGNVKKRQGTHFLLSAGLDKDAHSDWCFLRESSQLLMGLWQWWLGTGESPQG